MIDSVKKYIEACGSDEICTRYLNKLEKCASGKAVADVLLDINGIEHLAPRLASGKIAPELLSDALSPFANGKYVRRLDGYESAFYVAQERVVVATTALLVVNCRKVVVPKNRVCEIHMVGEAKLEGEGIAKVYHYYSDGTKVAGVYGRVPILHSGH